MGEHLIELKSSYHASFSPNMDDEGVISVEKSCDSVLARVSLSLTLTFFALLGD